MSIFSELIEGKITFAQAATELEADALKLINANPAVKATVDTAVADIKQQASNVVSAVDTGLAPYYAPVVATLEAGADTLFASLTKGASTVANPLINSGIAQAASVLKAVIDAAASRAQAALAPAVTQPQSSQEG